MKKLLSILLSFSIILGNALIVNAASPIQEIKEETLNYVIAVNTQMGINLTDEDISILEDELERYAESKVIDLNIDLSEAYTVILEEFLDKAPIDDTVVCSSEDDIGTHILPAARQGDIFFTDNGRPYNHVGLYTDSMHIVESMPKDGVKYWDISNREAWQSVVNDDVNDSCVLRMSQSCNKADVAGWAIIQVHKPYDYVFFNNKTYTNADQEAFNCSELVWKAYDQITGYNIDSDGGSSVFPNDIYYSPYMRKILRNWQRA